MGGGGGGRSTSNTSTSSVNTTTQVSTNEVDNSVVGDGAIVASDGATVTVSDFGAVDASMDLAGDAIESVSNIAEDAFDFVGDQNEVGLDFLAEQLDSGRELSRQAMRESSNIVSSLTPAGDNKNFENYLKYGAIIIAVGGVVYLGSRK